MGVLAKVPLVLACLSGSLGLESVLAPISISQPQPDLYPPRNRADIGQGHWVPVKTTVVGVKHTNKFWGNWQVARTDNNPEEFAAYAAPWVIKRSKEEGFQIAHELEPESKCGQPPDLEKCKNDAGEQDPSVPYTDMLSHFNQQYSLGCTEAMGEFNIINESHFGIHTQVVSGTDPKKKITYPVFNGMAYISAKYEGDLTPVIKGAFEKFEKQGNGWFARRNNGRNWRVYLVDDNGDWATGVNFVNSVATTGVWSTDKPFNGWVRIAAQMSDDDEDDLESHARCILTGIELHIEEGKVEYRFETVDKGGVGLLHFAYSNHLHFLDPISAAAPSKMSKSPSTMKGDMHPMESSGNKWVMKMDLKPALEMSFFPAKEPLIEYQEEIKAQAAEDLVYFRTHWRSQLFKGDHYFSGKGFQKLGYLCLMTAKFLGKEHADTRECAELLNSGFRCMYDPKEGDRADGNTACWNAPPGSWYDITWGGLPSKKMDGTDTTCMVDFGNYCYNDHHYHWGYYVVAGAILVELKPEIAKEQRFLDLVNNYIRDASNPSLEDKKFPQFRSFDWFDMHSWSRGLVPSDTGKDQESTTEEVNLHFGVMMWGKKLGNRNMEVLGATMITAATAALQEYFLPKRDNRNFPARFSVNHVTGIFFQGQVRYTTWFGQRKEFIHGIQMLPLTPATSLSRDMEFTKQEWEDNLKDMKLDLMYPWMSLIITGNLAFHQPGWAFELLRNFPARNMDDGLIKSWALFWTACQR